MLVQQWVTACRSDTGLWIQAHAEAEKPCYCSSRGNAFRRVPVGVACENVISQPNIGSWRDAGVLKRFC